MRKLHLNIVTKKHLFIITLTIVVVCAAWFFLRPREQTKMIGSYRLFSQVIMQTLPELQARWELGDVEENFQKESFQCSDLIANSKLVGQEYLQCNRLYLECFLRGKTGNKENYFKVKMGEKSYQVSAYKSQDSAFFTSLDSRGSVILNLQVKQFPGKVVAVKLHNTCSDLYLPHGIYSAGTVDESRDTWDNFGQKIYIDKYYVTKKDVNEWIEAKKLNRKRVLDPMWLPFPATDLTEKERIGYCAFRGKQLLDSRVLDAASFIPDPKVNSGGKVYKSPYHWTKGKRESFLFQARTQNKTQLSVADCNKAYVASCQRKSMAVHFPADAVTWMGMKYPLGFYPEFIVNHFHPEYNLVPSSFYFPASSPVHEVGYRGKWDGHGFGIQNISLDNIDMKLMPMTQFEIAFRCMKVVSL